MSRSLSHETEQELCESSPLHVNMFRSLSRETRNKSILFHNTQLLALIVIKAWENGSSALEEVETVNSFVTTGES